MMDIKAQPTSIRSAALVRWESRTLAKLSIKVKFLTPECFTIQSIGHPRSDTSNEAFPGKLGVKEVSVGEDDLALLTKKNVSRITTTY
jgi:hypothetical protein